MERHHRRPLHERMMRSVIAALFARPDRLRKIVPLLRIYQRLGLQRLARALGILSLLPADLRAMEQLLPDLSREGAATTLPERIARARRKAPHRRLADRMRAERVHG